LRKGVFEEVGEGAHRFRPPDGKPKGFEIPEMIAEAVRHEAQDLFSHRIRLEPGDLGHAQPIAGRLAVLGVEVPAASCRFVPIHEQARRAALPAIEELHAKLFSFAAQRSNSSWLARKRPSGRMQTGMPSSASQPRTICKTRHSPGLVKTTRSG
jgi:hypothetical protein